MTMQKLTPQEQQLFDIAAKQAIGFITDGKTTDVLLSKAKSIGPEKAAVDMIVPLMGSIYASAKSGGAQVPMHIIIAVAVHVLNAIAELMVMAGVLKEGDVQQFSRTVAQQAIQQNNSKFGGAQ